MSVAVGVGYEFATSDDLNWGGFCQTLEQAQQECQAVAAGDLFWDLIDEGVWAARDTINGALYQIEQRALWTVGERKSDGELRREYEADQAYRRDKRLKAELTNILLAALARGPDTAFLVQRTTGHDLARL